MKKLFKVMGVVAVCAAFSLMVYNQVNAKPENSILAKNIEALSQSEGGGSTTMYNCKLKKDDCKISVSEIMFAGLVARYPNLQGKYEKGTLNLTDMTELYLHGKGSYECRSNKTCNDVCVQFGILNPL